MFRSLCEFVGDCFGPRYFSSGAALPQKNTSVQNNHLRFHTMTSKKMVRSYYCLIRDDFKTQPPVDRWFCPLPGRLSLFRTIESDRNWTKPPVNQRFIFEVIPYIKDKLFSFPGRYELGYNLHIFYRIVSNKHHRIVKFSQGGGPHLLDVKFSVQNNKEMWILMQKLNKVDIKTDFW